jgi:multidrug resistance protein, MATE family
MDRLPLGASSYQGCNFTNKLEPCANKDLKKMEKNTIQPNQSSQANGDDASDESTQLLSTAVTNSPVITQKKAVIQILKLAVPIVGTMVINVGTNYLAGVMLGSVGTEQLAVLAIINAIENPLTFISVSALSAVSPLISRNKEQHPSKVGKIMQQGYLVAIIGSLPAIMIRLYAKPILLALRQSPQLVEIAESYFNASVFAVPTTILSYCDEQLILASNKRLIYVCMSLSDLAITGILGYILIFGKLNMPSLGAQGLSYAIAARSFVSFTVYKFYFLLNKEYKNYQLFNITLKNLFENLSGFLKISLPISVYTASKMSYIFVATILIGLLGQSELVAQQIIAQYILMSTNPVTAISIATSIGVGKVLGDKNIAAIRRFGNAGILLGIGVTSLTFTISASMPTILASPFINVNDAGNAEIVSLLRPLFMLTMGNQLLEGIDTISASALKGLADTMVPMFVVIGTTWMVSFPLAYTLGLQLDHGILGLAGGTMIGFALAAVLQTIRWGRQSSEDQVKKLLISSSESTDNANGSKFCLSTSNCFFQPFKGKNPFEEISLTQQTTEVETAEQNNIERLASDGNKSWRCTIL